MGPDSPPRLLVVSSWAPPKLGGPQALYNLFSQYPPESYVVLTSANSIDERSGRLGTWLRGEYAFIDREGPWTPPAARGRSARGWTALRGSLLERLRKLPPTLPNLADELALAYWTKGLLRKGRRLAAEGGISMLFGISDEGAALVSTYLLHRLTGLPYTLMLFDLYRGNLLRPLHRAIAAVLEPVLLRKAAFVVVTNDSTEDLLRQRYGRSFRSLVIPNSTLPEQFERARVAYEPRAPFRILFTGNVYWAQEQAVLNLVGAMDHLRDLPVELDLYVPQPTRAVSVAAGSRANVRLLSAAQSEMPAIQSAAALLVVALSWNTGAPEIIATASPGKLTDYLASGRPILVHAPAWAHVSRLVREKNLGLVVDQNDERAVAAAIRSFLADPGRGRSYVARCLRHFAEYHDARRNAAVLWDALKAAGSGCGQPVVGHGVAAGRGAGRADRSRGAP